MNLWVIFLTGLTVGGLTCVAVQGGLLTSVIATREREGTNNRRFHGMYATGVFLLAKTLAYTALGFILGLFGGALNIDGNIQSWMQLLAGMYMIAIAGNLLHVHPLFRYAVIQPPRFLTRLVRNQARSKDIFAPALLGLMTVFIPCGTTLAMETLAISSANAFLGMTIMAIFILGTVPMFLGIGFMTTILGETYKTRFLKVAAIGVLYLGVTSINGALVATNLPSINLSPRVVNSTSDRAAIETTQNPEITITSGGYTPNYIRVEHNKPVRLTLHTKDAYTCASAFRIPAFGIAQNLTANETEVITFTPTEKGKYLFSCSMGMYQGVIEVL